MGERQVLGRERVDRWGDHHQPRGIRPTAGRRRVGRTPAFRHVRGRDGESTKRHRCCRRSRRGPHDSATPRVDRSAAVPPRARAAGPWCGRVTTPGERQHLLQVGVKHLSCSDCAPPSPASAVADSPCSMLCTRFVMARIRIAVEHPPPVLDLRSIAVGEQALKHLGDPTSVGSRAHVKYHPVPECRPCARGIFPQSLRSVGGEDGGKPLKWDRVDLYLVHAMSLANLERCGRRVGATSMPRPLPLIGRPHDAHQERSGSIKDRLSTARRSCGRTRAAASS